MKKISILSFITLVALSGCGGSSSTSPPPPPPPPPPVQVEPETIFTSIAVSSAEGDTATTFSLSADTAPNIEGLTYTWSFSDGQSFTTEDVDVSFTSTGLIDVEVLVTGPNGGEAQASESLLVREAGDPTPDFFQMADRFSDINDDGLINLDDYVILAQHRAGFNLITDTAQLRVADLDIDNEITDLDSSLLGDVIIDQVELPTAVFAPTTIMPLSSLTVVSPNLSDSSAQYRITVGGVEQTQYARTILGYVSFAVPIDAPIGQDISIVISDNNQTLESYTITIEPTPGLGAAPADILLDVIAQIEAETANSSQIMAEQFGDTSDLVAYVEASNETIITSLTEIHEQLSQDGAEELAVGVATYLYANGFTPNNAQSAGQKLTGPEVCILVDGICRYKSINRSFGTIVNDVASDVCVAASLTATAIAAAAAAAPSGGTSVPAGVVTAVTAITALCVPLEGTLAANEAVYSFAKEIDFSLDFQVEKVSDEAYNLTTSVILKDGSGICAGAINGITNEQAKTFVADKFADVVERRIKRKIPGYSALSRNLKKISEDIFQTLEDAIQDGAREVIDATGVSDAAAGYFAQLCTENFESTPGSGPSAPADISKVLSFDANRGALTSLGDGEATFECLASSTDSGPLLITATKDFCGRSESQSRELTCGAQTNVTIRFGDNGSLTDDIFEVRIADKVFTSNTPQTSVTGEILLPSGQEFVVTMRGRAAPDGIGTYFISFTGAQVIRGDATSGSDLVPGTSKTFVIRVN